MILIADSGSTKTDWCLLARSGKHSLVQTQGMNPYQQSIEQIKYIIGEELLPQIAQSLWIGPIEKVFFYGAGCTPQKKPLVAEALQTYFRKAQVVVESDMVGAAVSLFGREQGIACILGTGSNSCYWDGEKIAKNVPSLGYVLDDEGSGSALGKRLASDLLKGLMGEPLREQFLQRFQTTQADIIENIYRKPLPNRYLASLSIFAAENIDNAAIRDLLHRHFRRFVRRNLFQYPHLPVGLIGSIAYYYAPILTEVLTEEGFEVKKIEKSPMAGLIQECKQMWTD